ncbi:MAG: penicillin-binding protein 2 [Frankiales bacterium]|nr:penicillin-binding protein 2 [Frankiales bacterium]
MARRPGRLRRSRPRAGGYRVRSHRARVAVLRLLLASLMLTLVARLAFVQLLDEHKPIQTAGQTHVGTVAVPATRGEILDSRGRVLVGNESTHVLTVSRETLQAQPDQGVATLTRLARVLGTTEADLAQEITPCGVKVPAPCWTGEPYQPVPVATSVSDAVVLAVSEHAEQYPGVSIGTQTVLDYPGGTLAAHVLGYTGAVSAADQKTNKSLADADTIGRSGLESSYDAILRGVDGQSRVELDAQGNAVASAGSTPAQSGDTLVTSIDASVQALAEKSLSDQIAASQKSGNAAPSGALVVMDPHTGRIIAAASYPTYDPAEFVGGISVADYQKLIAPSANSPLLSRAIAGQYAPGSTFKLVSLSDDFGNGSINANGTYPCPGSLDVDGRIKTNYDSESFGGPISPAFALQVSCDTFFYAPAVAEYESDQARIAAGQQPLEQLQAMAKAFGFGSSVGVDLPADEQADGSIAGRASRLADWNANKSEYCAEAKSGYPDESDPTTRAYLTQLASENCTDGWRYRAGDNADLAIGQGETTVSPLQLATAYSAMVNGGTLYAPTLGWAEVNPAGKVVKTITPKVVRKVPVPASTLEFFGDSLHFEDSHSVSGALAFDGSPIKTLIGGKTGTAEVYGKQDTSWFASWGPVAPGAKVGTAKFVVVGMVEQAGTGASAAAPMVRKVFEGLLGANGPAVLPGSKPASTLPKVSP